MRSPSRRTLLANCAASVTAIVSMSGCLSNGNGDSESESDGSPEGSDGSGPSDDSNEADSEPDEASQSGDGGVKQVEISAEISEEVVYTEDLRGRIETVVVGIVDENGESVSNGRVMVAAGSAKLESPQTAEIGSGTDAFGEREDTEELASNEAGFGFTHEDEPAPEGEDVEYTIGLRSDQNQGTLGIEIIPPSDSNYTDSLRNAEIVVIEGSDDEGSGTDA